MNHDYPRFTRRSPQREVIVIQDLAEREAYYAKTNPIAPLEPGELACGVARHPETGLYQLWLSTNGFDVFVLNAKRDCRIAQADQDALQQVLGADPYQEERVAALLARLTDESDGAPRLFPDEIVRQICQGIVRALAHQPCEPG